MLRITIVAFAILLFGVAPGYAQRWEKMTLPAPYDAGFYLDIFFLPSNPQLGWACDQTNGYIIKTTNGGATWLGLTSIKPSCHLEYIQFLDANTGYCSGPCGAYKSTNGGATWTEIVPNATNKIWGGWFRDANTGWFTGGTCGRSEFLRTTDGGATFNVYIDSAITRSVLTDPLWDASMATDEVYAVGNGTLWKSTDDGLTFNVFSYTGTTSPWHEELAHYGNSFAVACAGSNCPPDDYNGGGMRFSVDGGVTWRHQETGEQVFGIHLFDELTAWASGFNGSVHITTDGGQTWDLRNCGLEGADTDDVLFLDAGTGWLVGEGVFRLAPPKRTQSDTALAFSFVCPDSTVRDTVTFRNLNFFSSTWTATIIGADADLFRISSSVPASINPCQSVPIVVEYTARRGGAHNAVLRVDIRNPDTTLFVSLRGDRREKSAVPRDTLITFTVRVGTTDARQLMWRSLLPWNEQVTQITRVSGDTSISLVTPLPLTVIPEGVQMLARSTPTDTGWAEAKFRVRLMPCARDTIITVRVYGISPILESITTLSADMACNQRDTLRIPIRNTGNAPLDISDIMFSGPGAAAFRVLYWTSGRRPFPETFAVGESDTLLVEGRSITGDDVADIVITNNDYSTKRGKKTPWRIAIRLVSNRPSVTATPKIIDLGSMCVGSVLSRSFEFNNLSMRMGTMQWKSVPANVKGLNAALWYLTPGQRRSVSFQYTPTALGAFSDTLTLLVAPCDTLYTFIIKGVVNDVSLLITPSAIDESTPSGTTITSRAVVRMVGPGSTTVSTIWLIPPSASVTVTTIPALPTVITASDSIVVLLRFVAQGETTVQGTLRASATVPCATTAEIPVRFRSMLTDLDLSKRSLSFQQRCTTTTQRDTVRITWRGSTTLSMRAPVVDVLGSFVVEQPTTGFLLTPDTPYDIVVAYTPSALGTTNALLTISDDAQAITIGIPLTGDLRMSNPVVDKANIDFGLVDVCQPPIDSIVTIYNRNANERAVLSPFGAVVQGGISLVGAWPLIVEPNDSATVVVRSSPVQASLLAAPAQFTLRDETCGGVVFIGGQSSLTGGGLVMEPGSVDVGSMDTGLTARRTVIIYNPSPQPRTIVSLLMAPALQEWTLSASLVNVTLQPGDTVGVDVIYAPQQAGVHATDLILVDRGLCEVTTRIQIRGEATVPLVPPQHIVRLFIDDYKAGPGDLVSIPVHWQNDVSSARIDSVHIVIEYSTLPFLIDTVVAGELGTETKVTWTSSEVEFKMRGDGTSPLGTPGVIGVMHGRARSSIPDSTGFVFKSVVIWSIERVDSAPNNGSLVVDACGPRFYIKLVSPTSFSSAPSPDGIVVRYNALQNDQGVVSLYEVSGARVSTTPFTITAGQGEISIPLQLSSGAYVVHVESATRGRLSVLHAVVR